MDNRLAYQIDIGLKMPLADSKIGRAFGPPAPPKKKVGPASDIGPDWTYPPGTPETPKSNFLYFTVRQSFGYRESSNTFSNQK